MQNLLNTLEDDSCDWHPLECGVVNLLTIFYGYEEGYWKGLGYPQN